MDGDGPAGDPADVESRASGRGQGFGKDGKEEVEERGPGEVVTPPAVIERFLRRERLRVRAVQALDIQQGHLGGLVESSSHLGLCALVWVHDHFAVAELDQHIEEQPVHISVPEEASKLLDCRLCVIVGSMQLRH
ncbi:hypothetical protein MLD38_037569 [Melastoma candidum]|uniref:Uncharacterized protein n=1 Tax=Melastoma candidum TaxID=119954 RepID=A0ACB9LMP7_9MYRT|nr:hypothetical protein MLD38_040448 [Melastoma candidum]KAI4312775.1 hypothetical protein MLD38_037569 [Melastoma candidum]